MIKVLKWLVFVAALVVGSVSADDPNIEIILDDMVLTKEQYDQDFAESSDVSKPVNEYRWPDRTVPVIFDDESMSEADRRRFKGIADIISDETCIKFLYNFDVNKRPNHVFVQNNTYYYDCRSRVGFQNIGRQIMQLSARCNIMHNLLHVLGFYHIHQASNRDEYIQINYDNIVPKFKKYFRQLNDIRPTLYGTPYDYYSMMHYPQYEFSLKPNELKTIVQLQGDMLTPELMGQQFELTKGDIQRVSNMYQCS